RPSSASSAPSRRPPRRRPTPGHGSSSPEAARRMGDLGFEIDPDVASARTPPGSLYADPELFARAKSRVFAPSWQVACDAAELSVAGSVRPLVLHEGLLDEPIVITRDASGRLHALSNVCTHRGNLVVREPGRKSALVCGYH